MGDIKRMYKDGMPIGKLEPFSLSSKQWPAYIRRVNQRGRTRGARNAASAAGAPGAASTGRAASTDGAARPSNGGSAARAGAGACWRCGRAHRSERCRYVNYICDECKQRGHLRVMCRSVKNSGNWVDSRQNYLSDDDSGDIFKIIMMGSKDNKPYYINVTIDSYEIKCEIDTGSRISAINEETYKRQFSHKMIKPDNLMLRSYSGSRIESLGYIEVQVRLRDIEVKSLPLYVIKNGACPLLGRDWLRALKVSQINLHKITDDGFVNRLCAEYPEEARLVDSVNYVNLIEESFPISFKDVARETEKDSVLCKIKGYVTLRGRLDALRPDVSAVVRSAQERQVAAAGGTSRSLAPTDTVLARDYSTRGGKWLQGTIVEQTGPVSYKVDVGRGDVWRRHMDQIIPIHNKNRHSLSRTSIVSANKDGSPNSEVPSVRTETEDTCEDASDEVVLGSF
ncbi:hypothetical protein HW555_012777 [Spodoptera exigua]|uniref:Peptidase A2 domain-containing protein n=1 Tax=Spodoptera exigua TaxID=7107 RepID=A0A835L0E8_SPOEX|nr:hypothetical protein HW555_012777 [Spodoptera exigua]